MKMDRFSDGRMTQSRRLSVPTTAWPAAREPDLCGVYETGGKRNEPSCLIAFVAPHRHSIALAMPSDHMFGGDPVPIAVLLKDRGHVAIVMDGDRFLGLITRIDLLNWLRRRVQ